MEQPPKRVVTLSEAGLGDAARDLWGRVTSAGYRPDAIIGIATGGAVVAEEMSKFAEVPLFVCTLRRPLTAKNSQLGDPKRILRYLPYAITDKLRLREDRSGERRPIAPLAEPPGLSQELDQIVRELALLTASRILVVDDAVDSGVTLDCVVRSLKARLAESDEIRTAVITQTRSGDHALMASDYRLYDLVLCRFHWSDDFRGRA